jgi:predicted lipid-binding transport protein (Tim44 family)
LLQAPVSDSHEPRSSGTDEVGFTPDDFNAFEKIRGEVQSAYSAEDLARLRWHATPEILSYFSEELAVNASKGVVNRISDVKLLQGDLAEAWREGDTDYATVAMRFSLNDETLDRDSGRVLQGGPDEPTEVWTFMRARRPLAGVGDSAVVTPKTLNVMAGRSPGHFVCWRLAIARKFTPPACRIRLPWAAG